VPITATYTDQKDGTGVSLTIAGGAGGDTHVAYTQAFSGGLGSSGTWTNSGNRTGNGTIDLSLTDGHYFGYVLSNSTTLTGVEYFVSSDGTDSVHYRCLDAVRSKILLCNLEDLADASVVIRQLPSDRGFDDGTYDLPGIVISQIGVENQNPSEGTNIRDDVQYPVTITVLAGSNQDLVTNQEKYLKWREQINRALRNQRLTGVDEVYKVTVTPGPITSPNAAWNNYYHSQLIVRCVSREVRGL
jgi:hypothetical protein